VAQFGSFIQNTPGSLMDDRTTMNGKAVYHFKVFGIRAVVFVEAEIQMDDEEEHLNAIAQLIAECCGQAAFQHRICYLLLILFNPTACEWNAKLFQEAWQRLHCQQATQI
jgi:hypothetical protein